MLLLYLNKVVDFTFHCILMLYLLKYANDNYYEAKISVRFHIMPMSFNANCIS